VDRHAPFRVVITDGNFVRRPGTADNFFFHATDFATAI
jgi:hypothetical protein